MFLLNFITIFCKVHLIIEMKLVPYKFQTFLGLGLGLS